MIYHAENEERRKKQKIWGRKVKIRLMDEEITQSELAKLVGITQPRISNILSATILVSESNEKVAKISELLNIENPFS